jgi:hypothetical protein
MALLSVENDLEEPRSSSLRDMHRNIAGRATLDPSINFVAGINARLIKSP